MKPLSTRFMSLAFSLAALVAAQPAVVNAKSLALCASESTSLTDPTVDLAINDDVAKLFKDVPLVDGLLEPFDEADGSNGSYDTIDYNQYTATGGYNVISGKIASANLTAADPFQAHINAYDKLMKNNSIRIVRSAADLGCSETHDGVLDIILYQQKLWPIDFNGGTTYRAKVADKALAKKEVKRWYDHGIRIIQLGYSESENNNYYQPNEFFAGGSGQSGVGLTQYGEWVMEAALDLGMMLDISHLSNDSRYAVLDAAEARAEEIGRPVPVLANHSNLRDIKWTSRNLYNTQACRVAQSGGTVGFTPIQFMMAGASGTFSELVDHMDKFLTLTCNDANGDQIDMMNHMGVSTDWSIDGVGNTSQKGCDCWVKGSEGADRWLRLATYMYEQRGYSLDDIEKIFGANFLSSYRLGLSGSVPFDSEFCSIKDSGDMYLADADGDGFADAIFHENFGETFINFAGALTNGLFDIDWSQLYDAAEKEWCVTVNTSYAAAFGTNNTLFTGDFNGDGVADRLCHSAAGTSIIDFGDKTNGYQGTDWTRTRKAWCVANWGQRLLVGDVNGDGKDDLVCHLNGGGLRVDLANGVGTFLGTNWTNYTSWCKESNGNLMHLGDVNGDGRQDLICQKPIDQEGLFVAYANSKGQFYGTDWSNTTFWCPVSPVYTLRMGDFTGNGRDDLVCYVMGSAILHINDKSTVITNDNYVVTQGPPRCGGVDETFHVGDINNDGRDDLACFEPSTGGLSELYGQPNGTFTLTP